MRLTLAAAAIAAAFSAFSASAAPTDPAPAARAWLGYVDKGQYAQSWTAAGALFKAQVSQSRWARMVGGVRGPLGAVVSRTFANDEPSNALPGAPDGMYDQVHFSTVFAHKAAAVETVVMARQKEGWRVVGYFIR